MRSPVLFHNAANYHYMSSAPACVPFSAHTHPRSRCTGVVNLYSQPRSSTPNRCPLATHSPPAGAHARCLMCHPSVHSLWIHAPLCLRCPQPAREIPPSPWSPSVLLHKRSQLYMYITFLSLSRKQIEKVQTWTREKTAQIPHKLGKQ